MTGRPTTTTSRVQPFNSCSPVQILMYLYPCYKNTVEDSFKSHTKVQVNKICYSLRVHKSHCFIIKGNQVGQAWSTLLKSTQTAHNHLLLHAPVKFSVTFNSTILLLISTLVCTRSIFLKQASLSHSHFSCCGLHHPHFGYDLEDC